MWAYNAPISLPPLKHSTQVVFDLLQHCNSACNGYCSLQCQHNLLW